ncbi:MAG: isocitrate lyase/PEP mutase family protein [Gammaproteobacteria bacterium]|nr:isocitrate lyase/PEP mutase family protein [Gammaproteobacteria bacterium]
MSRKIPRAIGKIRPWPDTFTHALNHTKIYTPKEQSVSLKTEKLRSLFVDDALHVTPCCWDALSAKLIDQAGFPLTFMSGFGVSASRLGMPDTGLISFGEMLDQGRNIAGAVSIPVIGDGDTGYGNPMNVRRTVKAYGDAGIACIMIEDQLAPKRCGHTRGKQVVSQREAVQRIQAAVDTRDEGSDILILARTDAREAHGLSEAIERANHFREIGADITFVEAPGDEAELRRICAEVEGPGMVNIVEGGKTPNLSPSTLQEIGFSIATYPLTGLMAAINAINGTLEQLKTGQPPSPPMGFSELQRQIGFDSYFEAENRYRW